MTKALFCAIALFGFAAFAVADDVITLNLETPGLTASAEQPGRIVTTVATSTAKPAPKAAPDRSGVNRPVARVGIVTASKCSIYAKQSTKSRVYSSCLKDVSLAVIKQTKDWYGVMMVDGSTGWVQASKVTLLDCTTVLNTTSANRGTGLSRGDYDARTDGNSPIVQTALRYMGVPYVWGGNNPSSGLDCSAFVRTVYSQHGISLPRTAREQALVGTPVSGKDAKPGDRLYFQCKYNYIDHCGIYLGNGYFVHSSVSRNGVAVDSVDSGFYAKSLVFIMR